MQFEVLGIKPLISIVVPVYNVEKYIHRCVDSILAQTYTNLEIILINDGSADNSGKICDEYAQKDARINVIHKRNGGPSSARNEGIDIASGKYLSFIDSDDWVAANFIEVLLKTIMKFNTKIACTGYYFVNPNNTLAVDVSDKNNKERIITSNLILEECFSNLGFYACNKLFAKELFDDIRFPAGKLFEDMATISKVLVKADAVAVNNTPLYYYNRCNLNSFTKRAFSIKKLDYFEFSRELLDYAQNNNKENLIKIIKRERAYHISGFFRQMAENNFENKKIISSLQKELRKNIFLLLFSYHKLSNKLFAIVCCINFTLAKKIYLILRKNAFHNKVGRV